MEGENEVKRRLRIFLIALLIVITLILYAKNQHPYVVSSMIYQMANEKEIHLNVIMNTLWEVEEESISKEIIVKHQEINGFMKNTKYTLSLYRTVFHYKRNWEYDQLICNENGAILCCEEDLK